MSGGKRADGQEAEVKRKPECSRPLQASTRRADTREDRQKTKETRGHRKGKDYFFVNYSEIAVLCAGERMPCGSAHAILSD